MRVPDGRQRTHMPRESLGEEEVAGRPIDIRHRRVPQCVEGVKTIEPGDNLPRSEEGLDAVLADPVSTLLDACVAIRLTSTSVGGP